MGLTLRMGLMLWKGTQKDGVSLPGGAQEEGGHPGAWGRALSRHRIGSAGTRVLGRLPSSPGGINVLCQPPSRWHLLIAAWPAKTRTFLQNTPPVSTNTHSLGQPRHVHSYKTHRLYPPTHTHTHTHTHTTQHIRGKHLTFGTTLNWIDFTSSGLSPHFPCRTNN